uniref:Uncharacterized protein n=2 Tax=Hemiselmis andersenii TaxID=464988 RepID=A0A6U4NFC3_HEMAN
MEALGDYGSDDDDPEGEQGEASAPPPAFVPGPESSDDDDEEEAAEAEARKETEAEAARKKAKRDAEEARKRPSAASALLSATAKPTFLQQEQKADDGFDLPVDQPAAPKTEDEPPAKRQAVEAPPKPTVILAASGTPKPSAIAAARGAGGGKNSKPDTKDKVKTQRMRGQSAHATWKSEGEMKLRQQYD